MGDELATLYADEDRAVVWFDHFLDDLEIEKELHVLKLRDTVLRAGWNPDSEAGSELVGELMAKYVMEDIEGDLRPVDLVRTIATEQGVTPGNVF